MKKQSRIMIFASLLIISFLCFAASPSLYANINGSLFARQGEAVIFADVTAFPDTSETIETIGVWKQLKAVFSFSSPGPGTGYVLVQGSLDNKTFFTIDSLYTATFPNTLAIDYDGMTTTRYLRFVSSTTSDSTVTLKKSARIGGQ